jgi:hypothetical protein
LGWLASLALLTPLVFYARSGWMPLVALFGVAAGILVALMLVGRRLYDVMMADGLSGRRSSGSFLLTVGLMLLAVMLVLLGAAVAVLFSLREGVSRPPI